MQIGVITLFPHFVLCEDEETAEQTRRGIFYLIAREAVDICAAAPTIK